jgi:mono/diheme cytochrome c family protein
VRALPLVVTCIAFSACPRTPAAVADGGTAALATTSGGGDHRRGWPVYLDHCVECHGEGRRGDGDRSARLEVRPANLRDPLLLATRSDDQIAKAIAQGGAFVGKSKAMPAFREELSERDVMDLLALLRGDALVLEDCFPGAEVWTRLTPPDARDPVMAAYALGRPRAGRPRVASTGEAPKGGSLVGLALFTEVSLPRAGTTPVALLVDPSGALSGVRVGLPPGDREKAQRDLEAGLRAGKSEALGPLLERLTAAARRENP